ncbi:ABC transporter permease [Clostridium botulinum]|uniref:ABC transporter permease n=2 Tax=Clostridium botulinum TaxID=1491 RepID=A0A6B3ZCG7_CLOBO|nr:ABC transporter permease [Clostridium botulinum]ACO87229.1 putative membrane protein [Clostridium botulinum A2 str. Kyoto]APH23912.1 ABC-2 transporter family protein [Clostridium botulinum]APQ70515.1 ABC-2 transporter family protein [Clostridium botulinum]AUN06142.1 ABC transporter permease [Clostridium botulinum]EPS53772.1 hypothetical protein CLQ_18195 [Clostridium botulinum Af84]
MIGWEIKKIAKSKITLIAMAIFILLTSIMAIIKPTLEDEIKHVNEQHETVQDKRSPIVIGKENFNKKIDGLVEVSKSKGKDSMEKRIAEDSKKKIENIKDNEYKEVNFWKVFSYRSTHPVASFFMLIMIMLIVSNVYINEKISSVDNLILSSKNKFKCLYSKMFLAILIPVIFYSAYLGLEFLISIIQYGKPINGNLQAFRIIDNFVLLKGDPTIVNYVSSKIFVMYLVLISISLVIFLFSSTLSNSLAVISGGAIFIVLGKVCMLLKFLPKKLLMILDKVNYIDMLSYFDINIGMNWGQISIFGNNFDLINFSIGIVALIIIFSTLLTTINFKKFITN